MKILIACEESQRVCIAFRERADGTARARVGTKHTAKERSKTFFWHSYGDG